MNESLNVEILYESLLYELTRTLGLLRFKSGLAFSKRLFGRAARRAAEVGVGLDERIASDGAAAGARWLLPNFMAGHEARGVENIPASGPLIIASNHPGAVDALVISAHVTRPDYKIIIGHNLFFENLPHVLQSGIIAPPPENVGGRMQVVRESIRHLRAGGALLIFPRGGIEPDPDCMPNPDGEFHLWSRSLDIFVQQVPETRVLVTMVSGVIYPRYIHHPITYLRKGRGDRQRLAFLMQMARQVLSGRETFGLRPRVTFGELIQVGAGQARSQVQEAARRALSQHMSWQSQHEKDFGNLS